MSRYDEIIALMMEKGLLSSIPAESSRGIYFHKSQLGMESSLLVVSVGRNKFNIYELRHDEKGKVILGVGKDAVVREGVDVKTGQRVAIKLYPLYEKASCPRKFEMSHYISELKSWIEASKVNSTLPGMFLSPIDFFLAGDKTSLTLKEKENTNIVGFVISEKLDMSLTGYIRKYGLISEKVKEALIELFSRHIELIENGFCYADANFDNVLIRERDSTQCFCDPISLMRINPVLGNVGIIGLQIGFAFSLSKAIMAFLGLDDDTKNESIVEKVIELVNSFVDKIIAIMENPKSPESFRLLITEHVTEFLSKIEEMRLGEKDQAETEKTAKPF